MTCQADIDAFLCDKRLALAGASRSGKKFGNTIIKELSTKGFDVIPVHPEAETIDGRPCARSLAELSDDVDRLVAVVPPEQTLRLVEQAPAAGITKIWMQQGAESPEAVELCERNDITVVHGECILMFAEPVTSIHRFHRWIWRLLGKLPTVESGEAGR